MISAHRAPAITRHNPDTQITSEGGADLANRFLAMIAADYLHGNDAKCRDIEQMFLNPDNFEMFCTLAGINPERAQAKVFAMRPDRARYRRALGLDD